MNYRRVKKWAVQRTNQFGLYQETVFTSNSLFVCRIVRLFKGKLFRIKSMYKEVYREGA